MPVPVLEESGLRRVEVLAASALEGSPAEDQSVYGRTAGKGDGRSTKNENREWKEKPPTAQVLPQRGSGRDLGRALLGDTRGGVGLERRGAADAGDVGAGVRCGGGCGIASQSQRRAPRVV